MKRTYAAYVALNEEGRVERIALTRDALDPACIGLNDVWPVKVTLLPTRKPSKLGKAAAKRRAAGGPRVIGRPAVSALEWREMKARLDNRAGGGCEVPGCPEWAADPHHVIKTSQGGADALWNLVALCRRHHRETDLAEQSGRLVIMPAGLHLGFYGFGLWRSHPEAFLGRLIFHDLDHRPAAEDGAASFWRLYGPRADQRRGG